MSDDPPTYGEAPPAASPPPLCGRRASALPLPEAPYSLTVKVEKAGYDFLLTVRKASSAEFYQALDALPRWLQAHGFEPTGKPAAGNTSAEGPQGPPETARCPIHGTAKLKPSQKFSGWYCAGKVQDEWCKHSWKAPTC